MKHKYNDGGSGTSKGRIWPMKSTSTARIRQKVNDENDNRKMQRMDLRIGDGSGWMD